MSSLIKKYIKKPIEIEAVLYDGSKKSIDTINGMSSTRAITLSGEGLLIKTLEGDMTANVGDYVIKGIKGELYPCKPDIFHASYDLISQL